MACWVANWVKCRPMRTGRGSYRKCYYVPHGNGFKYLGRVPKDIQPIEKRAAWLKCLGKLSRAEVTRDAFESLPRMKSGNVAEHLWHGTRAEDETSGVLAARRQGFTSAQVRQIFCALKGEIE